MKILIVSFWCLVLCCSVTQDAIAQKKSTTSHIPKRAQKYFVQATQSYQYQRYDEAIDFLQKAIKKYPRYEEAYKRLANIAWEQKNYALAEQTYQKTADLFPAPLNLMYVNYYLGNIKFEQAQYSEAQKLAQKSLSYKDKVLKSTNLQQKVQRLMDNAAFAQYATTHPVNFNPMPLDSSVNSSYDEYLPMTTADEGILVFTRRLGGDFLANEDFYYTYKTHDTSHWELSVPMQNPINTPGDEGAICISPDGKRLFFAASERRDGLGNFDLYYCLKSDNDWVGPYNLGEPVNTGGWESQPSISADGKELYFCSKRKGSEGKIDIWMSRLVNNFWTAPVNLGKQINTTGDEQSPFIHPDGQTLYFSSNGHVGMGDADLYVSRRNVDGSWGKAENLGYPINTSGNENGLMVTADGKRAYYSSFRPETGLDIFYFDLPVTAKPQLVTYVKGTIFDAQKPKQKLSANIELIDLESGKVAFQTISDSVTGDFLLTLPSGKNYMYNVSKSGYLFYSEHFALQNNPDDATKPYLLQIGLQSIPKATDPTWTAGKAVVLKNVFFETGDYTLKPESYTELNKLAALLQENEQVRIEISGHTDSIGTASLNQQLSTDRAKAVYDYLVSQNIAPQRLNYKGYGSSRPIAPNTTPEGRAANRRTEFLLLTDPKLGVVNPK